MSAPSPQKKFSKLSLAKLKFTSQEACAACGRPRDFCLCGQIVPLQHEISVVILEHPQETRKWMNSAQLAQHLLGCRVQVGLSWRNLEAAVGEPARPSEWGVLVLRSAHPEPVPVTLRAPRGEAPAALPRLRGIIALDGNWQQAKTLWWRNPWLTKCLTIELNPDFESQRRQVKNAALSTLEAVAFCLSHLENRPDILETAIREYRRWVVTPAKSALRAERQKFSPGGSEKSSPSSSGQYPTKAL